MGEGMNIVLRYRLLRSDAIRLVRRHASRISGFDEHLAQAHPPAGLLAIGELVFDIETLVFAGGRLKIRGRAGASRWGRCEGQAVISGMDGVPALRGAGTAEFMGLKTAGTTWLIDYTLDLVHVRAEPQESRITETQDTDAA